MTHPRLRPGRTEGHGGSRFCSPLPHLLLVTFLALTVPLQSVAADWLPLNGANDERAPTVNLVTADESHVVLEVLIDGVLIQEVTFQGETYHRVSLPETYLTWDVGLPQLPELRRFVGIPGRAGVTATILEADTVELPEMLIYPAQQPTTDEDLSPAEEVIDEAFYQGDDPFPGETLTPGEPHIWRDVRVSLLGIRPFTYRPDTRTLTVHTRMLVEVRFGGHDVRNEFVYGERPVLSRWARQYEKAIINYDSMGLPTWDGKNPGTDLLVITVDSLRDSVAALADWHHREGVETDVVNLSDVGSTTAEIKGYIDTRFRDDNISAVLLVGDIAYLPIEYVYTSIDPSTPSDHWYACLEGGDLVADVDLARISATDPSMVAHQVRKILTFETNPPSDAWTTKSILCAYERSDYIQCKNDIKAFSYAYPAPTFETCYAGQGGTKVQVINAIEGGTQLVNYRGHGYFQEWSWSVGWVNNDIHALDNGDYCCLVFNICCENAHLDLGAECLSEAWMNANYGAAGNLGASRSSYTDPNHTFDRELYKAIFHYDMHGTMEVVNWAKNQIIGGSSGQDNAQMYLWLGDPVMQIWTDVPGELTVDHPSVALLGMTDFPVSVFGGSGPVEGARVCLMTESGDVYEVGFTGPDGSVSLSVADAATVQDLNVTVTAQNYVPYMGTVPLLPPSGPYVVCAQRMVDDDTAGESFGNGDGDVDAGETIELQVILENVGSDPAPGVTAGLTTLDEVITILDSYEEFGDIEAESTAVSPDDYDFRVSSFCPDGHVAQFELAISSGDSSWTSKFSLQVHAPVLAYSKHEIDDSVGGDGDGQLTPGEGADLAVSLENLGSQGANAITARLRSVDPNVIVTRGLGTLSALQPGEEAALSPVYHISVKPTCPDQYTAVLRLDISADFGYRIQTTFDIRIGGFADDMEAGEGEWTHYAVTPGFLDEWHLTTRRNHTPGGTQSWWCGSGTGYSDLDDAALVTSPMPLSTNARLYLWDWMDSEVASATEVWDGAIVEISTDDGVTWSQITPVGGYPYTIYDNPASPFEAGTPCFGGYHDWQMEEFDLSQFSGTVGVRFRFGSDGYNPVTEEGWYIDDVELVRDVTGVGEHQDLMASAPAVSYLGNNTPNPFNPVTSIRFGISGWDQVSLCVYDVRGRLVRTLVSGQRAPGRYEIAWDGTDNRGHEVASGLYFCRLKTADVEQSVKMMMLK